MAQLQGPIDEDYDSASDEDFNPDAAAAASAAAELEDSSSGDEDAADTSKSVKRKATAEALDFDNSGDEATIRKSQRKKRKHGNAGLDDEDGGEGGLIKTRAQRRAEAKERKPLVDTNTASIDVDALWAKMASAAKTSVEPSKQNGTDQVPITAAKEPPISQINVKPSSITPAASNGQASIPEEPSKPGQSAAPVLTSNGEPTIVIKRTYDFAGQNLTEERTVPASSAEARLYLAQTARPENPPTTNPSSQPPKPGLRRPKKRASIFDTPNSEAASPLGGAGTQKGPKLNTLEKSKLDWAQHVDQEGISEELDGHRRAKEGYLGRMDFLGRMDAKREEELKEGKMK